jgi:hypothetical protein
VAFPPQSDGHTTSEDVDARLYVQAQTLIREVNEQIHHLGARWGADAGVCSIVCECANPECLAPLQVPSPLYANVRRFPTRFVLLPEHVTQEFQCILEETRDYVVVEVVGPAADRLNRRREGRSGRPTSPP